MNENLLNLQQEALGDLRQLLAGVPDEDMKRQPSPGKWSVCQVVAHLAEDELTSSWRYRQMIERPGVQLTGFDQELWSRLGNYGTWKAGEAFEMFRLLREANVRMLARLTAEEWQAHGIHEERGQMTVESLAQHMTGHDKSHLDQIRRILQQGR
jgi:uncharacterized damage-inducible protein DinB